MKSVNIILFDSYKQMGPVKNIAIEKVKHGHGRQFSLTTET